MHARPCADYSVCYFHYLRNTSQSACRHIERLLFVLRRASLPSAALQRLDPHPHPVLPHARWAVLDERVGLRVHWNVIWLRSDVRNLCHALCRPGTHRPGPPQKRYELAMDAKSLKERATHTQRFQTQHTTQHRHAPQNINSHKHTQRRACTRWRCVRPFFRSYQQAQFNQCTLQPQPSAESGCGGMSRSPAEGPRPPWAYCSGAYC